MEHLPSPFAIYMRISTQAQDFQSQERELLAYCERHNWGPPAVFKDIASGAASRPQLDQLTQEIRAGRIHTVVVYKLDRLGRSLIHLALLLDEWTRLGVHLVATSQGIDASASTPMGKFQLNVLMAVAEFERGLIQERTIAGLEAAKAKGVQLGRPPEHEGQLDQIRDLLKEKCGVREISRRLGIPLSTTHRLVKVVRGKQSEM